MCIKYPLNFLGPDSITYVQSEDYLSLNLVRPAGTTSKSRLPVLVYIYGGGFQSEAAPIANTTLHTCSITTLRWDS